MRFHLIDRIDGIQPNRSVHARKITSHSESYWRDEGRGLEMPPPLALEALCQAGTWLVMTSTNFDRRAALLSIDHIAFGAPIRPGDVLGLEGIVESIGPETAVLSGRVTVDGNEILAAEGILCVLMPAGELEDIQAIRRMHRQLTRSPVIGRAA